MSTPVEIMCRFYEIFDARDLDAMRAVLTSCVWHIPGTGLLAGTYRGPDEILALFERGGELTEGSLTLELHDVVGDGAHAVGLDRVKGRRSDGRTIDMNRVSIAHMSDEQIDEVWLVPEDQYGFDEFWG